MYKLSINKSLKTNSNNLSWIDKDKLAGDKLIGLYKNELPDSPIFQISGRILRMLII